MERMEPVVRRQDQAEKPKELPMGDYKVQVELIKLWWAREHHGHQTEHNVMAMEWIDGGLAAKFSDYVGREDHTGETVVMDEQHLRKMLDDFAPPPTLH